MSIRVIILTGYGINADKELQWAFNLAGGKADLVHLEDLIENQKLLNGYQILAFPGGFSFGDHIASGKVIANIIKYNLLENIKEFIERKKLIIGICNGFQIITKLGLVPNIDGKYNQGCSLIENNSAKFEDRWVWVKNTQKNSIWLNKITQLYLPVRHGEGKFITKDKIILDDIEQNNQISLKYIDPSNESVKYPFNPNGSVLDIAGITNKTGTVFGLMPHPEAFLFKENHPNWTENIQIEHTGLEIFKNGIKYFK